MALLTEELATASKMRTFVSRYEQNYWFYTKWPVWLTPLIMAVNGAMQLAFHQSLLLGYCLLAVALLGICIAPRQRRDMTERYKRERCLLDLLEREHHDELPWHHPPPLPGNDKPPRLVLQA